MRDGNWIPLDKNLTHFLPRKRPYTILEAMFSFSVDMDNGDEKSIIAYSRIWSWSRCKVRRFVTDIKTRARHTPDRGETGTRQEVLYKFNNIDAVKDNSKTGARQGQDRGKTVTNYPNPNPKSIKTPREKRTRHTDLLEICEAWKAFIEMRKTIKKPMTEYAMGLRVRELERLVAQGEDPIAVLNQSTAANWQDLYAVKDKDRQTKPNGDDKANSPAVPPELSARITKTVESLKG